MLRKARISWDAVPNATSYTVKSTGNVKYEEDTNSDQIVKNVRTIREIGITNTYYDVNLDEYLADSTADTFEVKAVSSSALYSDSEYSTAIKIVDNPIIRADGTTPKTASSTSGTSTIEWSRISGVTSYTVKYRRLKGIHYNTHGWRPNDFTVLTRDGDTVTDSTPSSSARLKHTRNNLTIGEIYAIQLNYEQNGQKVFSGRDMFVLPSKGFPAKDRRVATYPYFAHWPDKEYRYRICEETFPEGKRTKWVNLINHAFEQWETATDGLITVTRDTTACPVRNRFIDIIRLWHGLPRVKSHINDVYMVNDSLLSTAQAVYTDFIGDVQGLCVFVTPSACAISRAYDPLRDPKASNQLSNATGSNSAVDILFRKGAFEDKSIDTPDSIVFNKCFPRGTITESYGGDSNTKDLDAHFAYTTALHEAGHALGTSGAMIWEIVLEDAQYRRAHPSIPDAVMNYDNKIVENFNPNFLDSNGKKIGRWLRYEHDCSPHPFDILAIYALYQHVDDSSDE